MSSKALFATRASYDPRRTCTHTRPPPPQLVFDNVKLPADALVGTLHGASICMMRNLEIERVTLAGMSLGIARRCIERMNAYAIERKVRSAVRRRPAL